MSNYFNISGYCSNSSLTKFGQELNLLPLFPEDEEQQREAFRIGTLFDMLETEPARIDRLNNQILQTGYKFSDDELKIWERKQKFLHSQPFYQAILRAKPEFQKEIYCLNFTLDGINRTKFKAKLDLYLKNWVIDLKTTSAESQQSFEYTCNDYGYFRQMIFYMTLTGSKNSLLIGVCKKKDKVFRVNFDFSHPLYVENLNMCKLLIQKYCLIN